jgi:hypothetical protein
MEVIASCCMGATTVATAGATVGATAGATTATMAAPGMATEATRAASCYVGATTVATVGAMVGATAGATTATMATRATATGAVVCLLLQSHILFGTCTAKHWCMTLHLTPTSKRSRRAWLTLATAHEQCHVMHILPNSCCVHALGVFLKAPGIMVFANAHEQCHVMRVPAAKFLSAVCVFWVSWSRICLL